MTTEPARILGLITSAATAVLALLAAFGVSLTDTQQAAILGLLAAAGPIVAGFLIRERVWSPASHEEAMEAVRPKRR